MTNNDLFSGDLERRLLASGVLGVKLYGAPSGQFLGDEHLSRGFRELKPLLPPDRIAVVEAGLGNSYGAWNPTVLFLGLSAGTRRPPRPALHQHSIAAPDFFEREPGGKGNPWLATVVKEITVGALRELGMRPGFEWLREWEAKQPSEFLSGAGGAATVLNFSKDAVPMGRDARVDHPAARETLLRWLRAFRPSVVVNLKPEVAQTLLHMFPECGLREHVGPSAHDEARSSLGRFADIEVPVVTMPVHPNAIGDGLRRMSSSKPKVARAIADALASSRSSDSSCSKRSNSVLRGPRHAVSSKSEPRRWHKTHLEHPVEEEVADGEDSVEDREGFRGSGG